MRAYPRLLLVSLLVGCGHSNTPSTPENGAGNPEFADTGVSSDGNAESPDASGFPGSPGGGPADGASGGGACTTFDAGAYATSDEAKIGAPCLPEKEIEPSFIGFAYEEVSGVGPPSGAPVCLVYFFRGLVTCPYGQSADAGSAACGCTTTAGKPVVGEVEPQCPDRPAASTVFWSCRCANEQGATSDGASYCTCPSGTTCTQTVSTIGASPENDYAGAYCLRNDALRDGGLACTRSCDPIAAPCP
jgi:hypothetical protein